MIAAVGPDGPVPPEPALPLLETRNLSSGYGGIPAVRGLNLTLHAGEVVVLLGPNGAGKTTTILTLAGEISPITGEVRYRGEKTTAPMHRRIRSGIGLVADDRTIFMGMSVAENLRLGRGKPARALELFPELREHVHRKAGLLSGGQQQMLSLGRALASSPVALLADELSLGLAPIVARRLLASVRRAADSGIGVLLVEQHARNALTIADRAYVLRRGEVTLQGRAADLLGDYDEVERAYLPVTPRLAPVWLDRLE